METDRDANMAYLLFRYKDWNPSRYYCMGRGEKTILRAFMKAEIDDRKKNPTMF